MTTFAVVDIGKSETLMRLGTHHVSVAGVDPSRPAEGASSAVADAVLAAWVAIGEPAPHQAFIGTTALPEPAEPPSTRAEVAPVLAHDTSGARHGCRLGTCCSDRR